LDAHLTTAIARAIVRRRWPSCVIEGLELRHGGNISTVYEVRCAEPDQPVIVKIYPDTFHWKMKKELYVYRLLGRTEGLPTPSILWSDNSKEIPPQNYVVMTTLKGQLLSQVESSLLAPELRDIYFEMGALLAEIHRITLAAFGYITTRITPRTRRTTPT
jgi:hygromycin-B 7''-O-kinase